MNAQEIAWALDEDGRYSGRPADPQAVAVGREAAWFVYRVLKCLGVDRRSAYLAFSEQMASLHRQDDEAARLIEEGHALIEEARAAGEL